MREREISQTTLRAIEAVGDLVWERTAENGCCANRMAHLTGIPNVHFT